MYIITNEGYLFKSDIALDITKLVNSQVFDTEQEMLDAWIKLHAIDPLDLPLWEDEDICYYTVINNKQYMDDRGGIAPLNICEDHLPMPTPETFLNTFVM